MNTKSAVTVESVGVVSVPVTDQERAKSFYVDQLGFRLVRDDGSVPGMRWIQVAPPSGGTQLTLVTWFDSMPAGSLRGLVLRMADLPGKYDALTANDLKFDGPPIQQPWGLETVVHDPDGSQIVLQQA